MFIQIAQSSRRYRARNFESAKAYCPSFRRRVELHTLLVVTLLLSYQPPAISLDPHRHITQYKVRVFKARDGLPANAAKDVFQDSRGYIWVAGQEGLARFDGVRFEKFDRSRYPGLGDDFVYQIGEDRNGLLWFCTHGGGISTFDGKEFRTFSRSNTQGLVNNVIKTMHIADDQTIWFGWEWGVSRYKDGTFSTYPGRYLTVDRHGKTYVNNQLTDWHVMRGDSIVWIHKGREWSPTSMCQRRSGEIIFGGADGTLFGLKDGRMYPFTPPRIPNGNEVSDILEDKDGNLWFTANGGGILRCSEGKLERFSVENGLPVNNNFFLRAMEDREGSLWFVGDDGLVELSDARVVNFGRAEGLQGNFAASVCEDAKGNIWAALRDKGIVIINQDTCISLPLSWGREYNEPTTVFPSLDGGVWIGMARTGLLHYKEQRFTHIEDDKSIRSLCLDRRGRLWRGCEGGVVTVSDAKTTVSYVVDSSMLGGGASAGVVSMVERPNGEMWLGTYKRGLFNLVDGKISRISEFSSDDGINAFYTDGEGVLWIATDGRGLSRFKNGTFKSITSQNGLAFDRLYSILEDEREHLWMSGNRGIFEVSKKELNDVADGLISTVACRSYNQFDGMRESECNGRHQPSAWKSRDGWLWFCSIGGIVGIDPNWPRGNRVVPPVYIQELALGDSQKATIDGGVVKLDSRYRNLSFIYTAPSFVTPERVRFKYRLDGFDPDWIDADTRREAFYTNIPKGNYTFHVIACNDEGIWNEQGASLSLEIAPFWWETPWSYSGYAISVGLVLFGIRKYELKRMKLRNDLKLKQAENKQLQELDHLRSRFFAGISHEFRTPLTLIGGPLEDLLGEERNPEKRMAIAMMSRNTRRLERLVDQLLDLAQLESGTMRVQARPVAIVPFLRGIVAAFESHAKRKNQQLKFVADGVFPDQKVHLDLDKMEKVFVNLLANALKYTPNGGDVTMTVEMSPTKDKIDIRVRDTGAGIPEAALPHLFDYFYRYLDANTRKESGTGIGLALAKELIEAHHGTIAVASTQGEGTEFLVCLPLGQSHLRPEELEGGTAEESKLPGQIPDDFDESGEGGAAVVTAEQGAEGASELPIVLLVEDNPDMRKYIRGHLDHIATILEAADGERGLQIATAEIPDLIISDVMMPVMDGFELSQRLKSNEATAHIPVILLTARGSSESRMEGLEHGADEYLTKPIKGTELRIRVKNTFERQQKLKEHYLASISSPMGVATGSTPTPPVHPFLKRVLDIVEGHISDEDFGPEELAHELAISRGHLNRRLHGLVGQRTVDFIRTIRLVRAAELLKRGELNVSEVASQVGFNHLSYFAQCFKQKYGKSPSEFTPQ